MDAEGLAAAIWNLPHENPSRNRMPNRVTHTSNCEQQSQ